MEHGGDGRPRVRRRSAVADGDLVSVVVEYPHATDRCTIYPPCLGESERLTCWLSADRDAFEQLDARR